MRVYFVPRLNSLDIDEGCLAYLESFVGMLEGDDKVVLRDSILDAGCRGLFNRFINPCCGKVECYYYGNDGNYFALGNMRSVDSLSFNLDVKVHFVSTKILGKRYKIDGITVGDLRGDEFIVSFESKLRYNEGRVLDVGSLSCKRKSDCDNPKGISYIDCKTMSVGLVENDVSVRYRLFTKRGGSEKFYNPALGSLDYGEFSKLCEDSSLKIYLDVLDESYEVSDHLESRVVSSKERVEVDENGECELEKFVEGKLDEAEFSLFKKYFADCA